MTATPIPVLPRLAVVAVCLAAACGKSSKYDPNDREVSWVYGPQTGGATTEHLTGTGKQGGVAIAEGWQCRLLDQKRLRVVPYHLAATHPLFGKVRLSIGLYDLSGNELKMLSSEPVTAALREFTFEVPAAVVPKLNDAVIWYVKSD